ncbi:IS30 family transposase [Congregibacter sp.]|nr:IS30 family transposase [Congregibacter sp.]MDA8962187.1 IS30 family transposase [Congregibacter sp.]
MKQRTRIYYTAEQKALMWDRWQQGDSMHDIARLFDRYHSSVQRILTENGGIRPRERKRSPLALTLAEREVISRGLAQELSLRTIARQLSRSPSTISREIRRNDGHTAYRASEAESAAWERGLRPKVCKLAAEPKLAREVTIKLQLEWSPEQIAGWLKTLYPDDERYHVSHETIYKSLFIQARGALKKELLAHLRTQRTTRRPRRTTLKGKGLGSIADAVSISERPASVEDRAVPGHWEGDLIAGSRGSHIATLVERQTRYVMLTKVDDKTSDTVINALIKQAGKLPAELYKSLTWDRGSELSAHKKFTLATDIQVYFCDPKSPWQRGSNENTNRLLRQYFPKGTDLSVHSQTELNRVARRLNERPRKTLDYETPADRFAACVASID